MLDMYDMVATSSPLPDLFCLSPSEGAFSGDKSMRDLVNWHVQPSVTSGSLVKAEHGRPGIHFKGLRQGPSIRRENEENMKDQMKSCSECTDGIVIQDPAVTYLGRTRIVTAKVGSVVRKQAGPIDYGDYPEV